MMKFQTLIRAGLSVMGICLIVDALSKAINFARFSTALAGYRLVPEYGLWPMAAFLLIAEGFHDPRIFIRLIVIPAHS